MGDCWGRGGGGAGESQQRATAEPWAHIKKILDPF